MTGIYEQDRDKQGIYAIVYEPTHRIVYVGQTINVGNRWQRHRSSMTDPSDGSHQYPLYRALRKHGIENYSIGLLEEVADARLLSGKEQYYFDLLGGVEKLYNLVDPMNWQVSYNGDAVYQIDPETLEIIDEFSSRGQAAREIGFNSSSLNRLLIGQGYSIKGYYWCRKEDWYRGWKPIKKFNNRQAKPIIQMDLDGNEIAVFPSGIAAAKSNPIFKIESISGCARGIQPTAYGYKWRFANEVI
jgi:hypothetical protein